MTTKLSFEAYLYAHIEDFQNIAFSIQDNYKHLSKTCVSSRDIAFLLYNLGAKRNEPVENVDYLDTEANAKLSQCEEELCDENSFYNSSEIQLN